MLDEIARLREENNRLREIVGSWRRKAQERGPKRHCVREGYDHNRFIHYKVYAISDIPEDLCIEEVTEELKNSFLSELLPYTLDRIDYSKKYKGWMLQVSKDMCLLKN